MKRKLLKVGKWSVKNALGFGYDGCHKIYVAESPAEIHSLESLGYKIYPMIKLEKQFVESCPLRFISWEEVGKPDIVSQCARRVVFTYNTGKSVAVFNTERTPTMSKTKKQDAWIVTLDEVFYYKEFHHSGKDSGWEFTPYIECAYQFPTEAAAKGTLVAVTSGGDFKDSRGHVTPTTSFGMRKMTRKDYNEIKKRQDAKTFFRKKEQEVA